MSATIDTNGRSQTAKLDVERAVRQRYSAASQQKEQSLCCPVEYDTRFLEVLPAEIIERDYGCGDPSRYVAKGDRVLDLGSGTGKICYIASQIAGPDGRVCGVDMNDDMLHLARKYQDEVANRIGWHNVRFVKGRIQDLALDMDAFAEYLADNPIENSDDWLSAESHAEQLRRQQPMIADNSIDVVLSNCVLNLVTPPDRDRLFREIFRVLDRGGRAVVSDIVSDEPVPEHLKNDPKLWSGCMSGAFVEHELPERFERAGFYGMEVVARQDEPWAVVEGIEFRSVTVRAYKGKQGPCMDHHQAVIYKGPWKSVTDDDGHVLRRGVRTAVCAKTFAIYTHPPYSNDVIPVPPYEEVAAGDAAPYDCRRNAVRDARTKGQSFDTTQLPVEDCCGNDRGCC